MAWKCEEGMKRRPQQDARARKAREEGGGPGSMGDGGQRRRGCWEGMDTGSQAAGGEAEGDEDGTASTSWHECDLLGVQGQAPHGLLEHPWPGLLQAFFSEAEESCPGCSPRPLNRDGEERQQGPGLQGMRECPPGHRKPFILFFFFNLFLTSFLAYNCFTMVC